MALPPQALECFSLSRTSTSICARLARRRRSMGLATSRIFATSATLWLLPEVRPLVHRVYRANEDAPAKACIREMNPGDQRTKARETSGMTAHERCGATLAQLKGFDVQRTISRVIPQ